MCGHHAVIVKKDLFTKLNFSLDSSQQNKNKIEAPRTRKCRLKTSQTMIYFKSLKIKGDDEYRYSQKESRYMPTGHSSFKIRTATARRRKLYYANLNIELSLIASLP